MIQNDDNRMSVNFNKDSRRLERNMRDPLFKGSMIVNENLAVTFHSQRQIEQRQLWPVGFVILEEAKAKMTELWYEAIKPAFGQRAACLMSDTDSFLLINNCSTVSEAMSKLSDVVDTSNYPPDHPLFNTSRKNEVGYLKDELGGGSPMISYVGLKAKVYTFKTAAGEQESRCKGVKRAFKDRLTYEDYRERLVGGPVAHYVTQLGIQSRNHQNVLIEQRRRGLSSFDDKRFSFCAVHSAPYGSHLIDEFYQTQKCPLCARTNFLM